jgi:hypothetical protein
MDARVRVLRELVRESLYVLDERAVADAIMARGRARTLVSATTFRSELQAPQPRSFRRDRSARSFRLSSAPHLRRLEH